ncbi:MAG: HlyD family efflux transporter periplasmic adaptor subunit [Acidobacteria bacterium]|nr:MAG: HlyD family efflux transporter periplasmic adaptor subunit [Acidobacteriota bacterium]
MSEAMPQLTGAPQPAASPGSVVQPRRPMRWGLVIVIVVIAGCIAAAVIYGRRLLQGSAAGSAIPTFQVEFGTVQVTAYAKGTLQGGQADRLTAPSIGGDRPRISFMLPAGSEVKPGDVVVRFDTGQEEFKLAQAENAAAQAAANVAAAEDQAKAQDIENAYSLQHARSEVQLAAIAVRKNPLLPKLDANNNLLVLRSARAELAQWEQDVSKQRASGQGLIAIQQAAEDKAKAQAAAAGGYIAAMTLRATRAGYVAVESNPRGSGVFYRGMAVKPFQVGDQVSAGAVVAQIPNLGQLQVQAKLSEAGSAYVAQGQAAEVQIEGVPGRVFSARVVRVSGIQQSFFSNNQGATCVLGLEGSDATLRPGMDVQARIVLSTLPHVLWVPAEALFQLNGKPVVYVQHNGAFSPQAVKVIRQGSTRVAISGIPAGTVVALSNPAGAEAETQP